VCACVCHSFSTAWKRALGQFGRDTSALVPKCPTSAQYGTASRKSRQFCGAEVSCGRSVRLPSPQRCTNIVCFDYNRVISSHPPRRLIMLMYNVLLNRVSGQSLGHHYGPGEGEIWMDNLGCTGSESSLAECEHNDFAQHNCEHNEDVSIACQW